MKLARVVIPSLAAASLIALIAIASCSKGSGGSGYTAPTSPGGGGTGGTTKELDSALLATGQQYSHTFNTAGTFPYHCSVHTTMRDTITVDAGATATSAAIAISGFQFTPKHTHVKPGATVTWTQDDSGTSHTVTSD